MFVSRKLYGLRKQLVELWHFCDIPVIIHAKQLTAINPCPSVCAPGDSVQTLWI